MQVLFIIFFVTVILFSVSSMSYIVADIIMEHRKKNEVELYPIVTPPPPVEKPVVPAPVVIPEILDHVDAEEADEILTDDEAMTLVIVEGDKATTGYRTFINIGEIDGHFSAGDTVTLEILKAKGLIEKKAKRVKILADGELTKPLIVKAHSFSIQAIKMIELTGGTVVKVL